MDSMFIVGLIIFILYITGLLTMINKSHNDQDNAFMQDPEIPENFKMKENKIKDHKYKDKPACA